MINLYISLRAELAKIAGSSIWLLTLVSATLVPVIMVFSFDPNSPDDLRELQGNAWNVFLDQGIRLQTFVFLPMFLVLICTLLPQIEYRNHTWKQLFASPQAPGQIFFSKFLVVQLLVMVFLLVHSVLMGVSGVVLNRIHPQFKFMESMLDLDQLLTSTFRGYVSVLAIAAFQFWMGLRFRNFFIPVGVGFILWFMGAYLVFEVHLPGIDYYPFAFPILVSFTKYASVLTFVLFSSAAYLVAFLTLGCLDFSTRKEKG